MGAMVALRASLLAAALLLIGATASNAATDPFAPTPQGSWTARVVHRAAVYAEPGGKSVSHTGTRAHWAGGPNQLMVLASRTDASGGRWLRVQLPKRPNESSGWIDADYVKLRHTNLRIEVETGTRTVRVFRSGRPIKRFRAVVGAAGTPTPAGRFAISEVVRQSNPRGFIGPWALHLTAFSNVLDNYGGGPGRVAIHGRSGASLRDRLGSARSHGCIRIANREVRWLARHAAPGTPVEIYAGKRPPPANDEARTQ